MKIHHYDRETGVYLGSTDASPDPLEHKLLCDAARERAQAAKDAKTKDLRDRSPLTDAEFVPPEPRKFLVPAFATSIPPPVPPEGSEAFFADGSWSVRKAPEAPSAPEPEGDQ